MHLVVWEFLVEPEHVAAFEQAYGPDGDWARFFQRSVAFRGLELLRGADEESSGSEDLTYWTIDRWDSGAAYAEFGERYEREYQELDTSLAELCKTEECIGHFEVV